MDSYSKTFILSATILFATTMIVCAKSNHENKEIVNDICSDTSVVETVCTTATTYISTEETSTEPVLYYGLTQEEIELIALVTMAEAEAEPEEGQRLVIDTILNRVDDEHFPDTVYDVIYQKNQFECMWNGRADRCYVKEELCEMVKEELESRTNSEVIFFRTTRYSDYGEPMFQVGHHYFSSYD